MAIFVHCLSFCHCWFRFHLLSSRSPELLSIQAAPACSVTQGYSISDIVLNLHAKREKTQDMKDNCHKWLNGVQGGKVIMKPILSIEYPHLAFLQQLLGSTVHYSLGAGAGRKRYQLIKSLIQYDIWFLQLQFKITTQLCHSLLLLYMLEMQDSSASLQFGYMWYREALWYWTPFIHSRARKVQKREAKTQKVETMLSRIYNLSLIKLKHSGYSCKSRLAITAQYHTSRREMLCHSVQWKQNLTL